MPEKIMARQEADREDLFGEAAALVERAEFNIHGLAEPVTAGCRKAGGWSIYFGGDPCYHFDEQGRLRRAYAGGRLYRTQGRTLAELERVRSLDRSELRRHDLTPQELARFLEAARRRLAGLSAAIRQHAIQVTRLFPNDATVTDKLEQALKQILNRGLRLAPPIRGRT
jgi:hypothetical protein